MNLPDIVQAAVQAVAKDEKRILFPLTKIDSSRAGFDELYFQGDHSDIGRAHGPNTNALSRAPLEYIHQKGIVAGAEFGPLPTNDPWASNSTIPHDLSWQAIWWNPFSWPMVFIPDRER